MKKIFLIAIIATSSIFSSEIINNNLISKANSVKAKNCEVKISYKNLQYPNVIRTKVFNSKNRLFNLNKIFANSNTYKFLIEFDGKRVEYTANKGEKSWVNSCGVKVVISKNSRGNNFTSYKVGYNILAKK